MDLATIIGIAIGTAAMVVGILLGGSLAEFIDIHGILVIGGGTLGAVMIGFPMRQLLAAFKVANQTLFSRVPDAREELKRFVDLATVARREGLLGLEPRISSIKDPFLRRGLEMVIDNTPVDKMQEVLGTELHCIQERHHIGKKIFEQIGTLMPAMGMVGTLMGMVQMLGKLEDPSKIGSGMALALVCTFYGALGSNLIFLPIANKLEIRSKHEVQVRTLMIQGLSSLLEGDSPRAVESKLNAFLAPGSRHTPDGGGGGGSSGKGTEAA